MEETMSANKKRLHQIKAVAASILLVMVFIGITTSLSAATQTAEGGAWGTGTLSEQNLYDLIAQMTVEEKDTFIHGSNTSATPCADDYVSEWVQGCQGEAGRIPGVATLGIPPLRLSDGPAGARLGHVETAMPAPVGLTASFDPDLAHLFGATVGRGLRATNQDVWLAPMMNMVNVPTAGRNFETLGEDPYLSSEMAVQLTLGSQSEGIIATLKHYVDNDFENGRSSTSVMIDEQTQREMELTSFEKAIKEGGAGAVMCSYNRINDIYACGNDVVLNQILKGEWGWGGWVMSDWGATHRPQDLINGLDMEQSGSNNLGAPVINAILLETYLTNVSTEMFTAALAGDSNIKVYSVAGFTPNMTVIIDPDGNAETRIVAAVGTAGTATTLSGGSTMVRSDAGAGSTTIRVYSADGFAVGQTVWIGSGAELEENTITGITLGSRIYLDFAAPTSYYHARYEPIVSVIPAGATNIKVESVTNLNAGNTLVVDVGPNQETVAITAVGTAGPDGTGVDITPALSLVHPAGGVVKNISQPGTGIDLTAALDSAHAVDTMVGSILPAGATNIKVADTSSIGVGQVLTIDTGGNQESATVVAVGTSGPFGSGIDLAAATAHPHADGAPVTTSGTLAVPLTNDYPAYPAYSGEEWSARLDDAVLRILTQMNNAGLLEGTQYGTQSNGCDRAAGINCTPFVPQRPDLQAIQAEEFDRAQYIAERSATLLKNDNDLLPLSCKDLKTRNGIVLMGPTAISTYTGGGGSAHVRPYDPVESTYDALIAAAKAKCGGGVKISYVPGYDLNGPIVPSSVLTAPGGEAGLLRQQITRDPVASGDEPVLYTGPDAAPDRVDSTVNYNWNNMLPANTAWRWTGVLTAPSNGNYALRVYAAYQDSAQLFVDGLSNGDREINMGSYGPYFPDSMSNSYATNTVANKLQDPDFQNGQRGSSNMNFSAGQQVFIDLRVVTGETMDTAVQFRWVPTTNDADQIAIAEAAAAGANKTLYFAYNEGSEGSDRGGNAIANGLALAGNQDEVITAVAAASPNTVVVLNTGDPVFMPWESGVHTILQMWYPGQMGGPATADVVLGNVNPSGKSPVTFPDALAPVGQRFPQDTQPAPCADNSGGSSYYGQGNGVLPGNPGNCPLYPGIYTPGFLGTNLHGYRTINYTDGELGGVMGHGILQGYRWFDATGYEPLFPFGHGLSYTTFEYRNLRLKAEKGGTVRVSFIVQNKGDMAGAVVPQVYVGSAPSIPPYAQQAVRALRGFDRVELRPNESKRVEITLDPRSFQYWDEVEHAWTFLAGERTIWVGDSSRDLRLSGTVTPKAQ